MSKFLPTSGFKWVDHKVIDLNKYTINSLKEYFPKVNLDHLKELQELHNDNPLALDKKEIKQEMLSEYQLKFADL